MGYKIEIETHAGQKIVHTYIHGSLSGEQHVHIREQTVKTLDENGITRSIWDVREAVFQYSLVRIHMFVVNAKATGLKDGRYSAVIYDDHQREYEHARVLSENLGLKNLSYFRDINQGIHWLVTRE